MYKRSGNPKVEELTKSIKDRSYNLSCLQAIKLPEMNERGKPKRLCAWCNTEELTNGNQKYCSINCSNSAMAWAYPQKEDALRFLLLRQDWKCLICKFDYVPIIEAVLERDRRSYPGDKTLESKEYDKLPWYYFKRLKDKAPEGRRPEVDHIVPISKGGASLGLDNHQAICYTCHKAKTKIDNSGPRNKL